MAKKTARVDMTRVDKKKLAQVLKDRIPKLVVISEIEPNPRNRNKMGNQYFQALKSQMADHRIGFTVPILVRPHPNPTEDVKYMIIDGEHRWRAAGELHYDHAPCIIFPTITDGFNDFLMVAQNAIKGHTNDDDIKAILSEALKDDPVLKELDVWARTVTEEPLIEDSGKYDLDDDEVNTAVKGAHQVTLFFSDEQLALWRKVTGQLRLAHGFTLEDAALDIVQFFQANTGLGEKTGDETLDKKQTDLVG